RSTRRLLLLATGTWNVVDRSRVHGSFWNISRLLMHSLLQGQSPRASRRDAGTVWRSRKDARNGRATTNRTDEKQPQSREFKPRQVAHTLSRRAIRLTALVSNRRLVCLKPCNSSPTAAQLPRRTQPTRRFVRSLHALCPNRRQSSEGSVSR